MYIVMIYKRPVYITKIYIIIKYILKLTLKRLGLIHFKIRVYNNNMIIKMKTENINLK